MESHVFGFIETKEIKSRPKASNNNENWKYQRQLFNRPILFLILK
jgi:hypothetical protein